MELRKMTANNKSGQPNRATSRRGHRIISTVMGVLLCQHLLGELTTTANARQQIIEGKTREEVVKELQFQQKLSQNMFLDFYQDEDMLESANLKQIVLFGKNNKNNAAISKDKIDKTSAGA